jgi:uncharacterized protein YkwD
VAAVVVPSAGAVTNCSVSSSWGTNRADLASQVVALVNQHRASIGRSQLSVSSSLTAASTWKSLHMAAYGYFAHDDPAPPVARSAYQRARDCGYGGSSWGENIAWGYTSAQSVVNGWLGSPGHRSNIESASYTSTGVGVAANASGQLIWTQNFGNDSGSTPPPPPPAPTPPAPSPPAPPAPTTPAAPAPAPSQGSQSAPVTAPAGPTGTGSTPSAATLGVGATPAHVTRQRRLSRLVASVAFVHLTTGRPVAKGSVRCRAEVDGKRLRVLTNAFAAKEAKCAWKIPGWAKGKRLTGVVALQIGDAAARRLFVRTIH